ncbi:hypothetical protein HCTV-15_gp94 [Haloarcula virus HCTV-15]|nr:hypothetical protein HCTV-6_gp94 [Haloarcula virus HCTV-6]UBF22568.1 hypothetical protein HCTV-15_gp94 [Haloarcula virus HCTV-15]
MKRIAKELIYHASILRGAQPREDGGIRPKMMDTTTPEMPHRYELLTQASTREDALVAFHEAFDDAENYTEFYDFHRYDDETIGVFFTAENAIDTDDEPMVLSVDDIEA